MTPHVLDRGIIQPVPREDSDPDDDAKRPAIDKALNQLVTEAARAFLEMLVLERHRIWLLHTVTAPAAAGLLIPELSPTSAEHLVAYSRQAVIAMYTTFGAPHTSDEHLRSNPPAWDFLIDKAANSGSVHTIKLVEALRRFAANDDRLFRSVAAQWFEWE